MLSGMFIVQVKTGEIFSIHNFGYISNNTQLEFNRL